MRPFTLKANIVAGDKASKAFNKITESANKMAKTISKQSKVAGRLFAGFSDKVGLSAKRAIVHLNNLDARVNRTFRNIKKRLGTLGTLGLSIGFAAIASTIINANIELDSSFASLSAITGKNGTQFEAFKKQVQDVAKEQTLFAGDVAKSFEVVASAQPILLDNAEALGKVTNAAITLSKASGDDLEKSALSLTGVMNQFNLEASQAERVMNSLAAGSVAGSANITNVAASMKNFGAVASSANISMEQSVALVEVMGSKSIFAEEAGTKLRGSILKLQKAGVGYASGQFDINDALDEARRKMDSYASAAEKDAFLLKTFGAENITTGQILLNNIDNFDKMTKAVTGTNTATEQMNIKANTFENRLNEITDAFKNSITATGEQDTQMQSLRDVMGWVAENMDKIISVVIIALKVFAAYKAIMLVVNIVTWAFNSALLANPITWIVLAIVGLIAAIAALIVYWEDIVKWVKTSDNVFAKLIRLALTPLMILFKVIGKVIEWISEKFSQLVNWVKTSDSGFASFIRGSLTHLMNFFQMIGDIIDWLGEKWNQMTNWISTSDSGFAKFLRGTLRPIIIAFQKLGELWDDLTGGGSAIDKIKKAAEAKLGIEVSEETTQVVEEKNANDKLIKELQKNTGELDKNTNSKKKEWKGRFSTTILRDLNVADKTTRMTQKQLAVSAVAGEVTNQEVQNSIINNNSSTEIVTKPNTTRRKPVSNVNGAITINVVDRTSGKFGIQVEGTGIDVVVTGNK